MSLRSDESIKQSFLSLVLVGSISSRVFQGHVDSQKWTYMVCVCVDEDSGLGEWMTLEDAVECCSKRSYADVLLDLKAGMSVDQALGIER